MAYLDYINRFWALDIEANFTGTETKLYFALLDIANKLYWSKKELSLPTNKLLAILDCSRNTLVKAREKLMQVGLISYIKGVGNKKAGKYVLKPVAVYVASIDDVTRDVTADVTTDVTPDAYKRQDKDKDKTKEKESIKEKEKKPRTQKVKYSDFVFMQKQEYDKLCEEYGFAQTHWMIEKLDAYKGSTGKKYRDDYRAILSWVVKAYEEEMKKNARAGNYNGKYDEVDKFKNPAGRVEFDDEFFKKISFNG
jgi:DNA-binding transcriptional regulator GbsR (MarR family)